MCPVVDQCEPVSTEASPVTVTAEVALNSASKKFVLVPELEDTGNISSAVPKIMSAVKATATVCVAESLARFFISGSNLSALTRRIGPTFGPKSRTLDYLESAK